MANENSKDDDLTVSKVYKTLKSPDFLRDIYWEVLSTMKEKNTFKNIRTALDRLINQSVETARNLGDSEVDELTRKTIVCQICSLSYAVDTIFSKISFLKMEKACKALIPTIVQELRNEGKISDDIVAKLANSTPVKEQQGINESSKSTNTLEQDTAEAVASSTPRKRKQAMPLPVRSDNNADTTEINGHVFKKRLGGRIISKALSQRCSNSKESTEENASTSASSTVDVPQNSSQVDDNALSLRCLSSNSKESIEGNASTSASSAVDILQNSLQEDENVFSDAESDVSYGRLSPVSSVHTSDLSSFDDEISLSSEDEGDGGVRKKKRMSLKELEKRFSSSRKFSLNNKEVDSEKAMGNIHNSEKAMNNIHDSEKAKSPLSQKSPEKKTPKKKTIARKVSSDDGPNSSTEANVSPPLNEKAKRIRKPNSKYSSDNILCPVVRVKERKKSSVPFKDTDESNSSDDISPKKKKCRTNSSPAKSVSNEETQKMDVEKNSHDSNTKTPVKQSDSSEVYKPHVSARSSLTSRRTGPLTLFST